MEPACVINIETLNSLPVNEKAGRMLLDAGERPEEGVLYCLSLVLWGIREKGLTVEDVFRETINGMTSWTPKRLANFFFHPDGEPFYDPPGWRDATCPEDLATALLEELEGRMLRVFPWYGHLE